MYEYTPESLCEGQVTFPGQVRATQFDTPSALYLAHPRSQ